MFGIQQSSGWGPAIVSLADGSQRLFANFQGSGHAPFYMTRNSAYSNWENIPRTIPGAPQYSTGRATARAIGNTVEVGYLEANYYGQPIPSGAEGYNMIRTAYDVNRGWAGYAQADEQGWRENSGFSINVADEMHNVSFSQMMHSANRNNINQMYVKYESVFSLFK
ncbi:hypothetical protein I8J29_02725 [Paenibacillus sp. MWE-103]|uniref:Uncharacterized protein n=1 Tax=Paenibacillus artemisiicola TaxID=1172618 RepID=A0ABS3W4N3_9BACL|nr:hypothetical protein [Paenibacillus artemisiicola]MBO7743095.1 hypothetical protein [Paenibacillus artemisiicola]